MSKSKSDDLIDFGAAPPEVNDLLQHGVFLYRQNRAAAEARFHEALALDPTTLAAYFCLYKIHAYQGRLDEALRIAEAGLAEAARQATLPAAWSRWAPEDFALAAPTPARFALYTLKAIAFVRLRRGEPDEARRAIDKLRELEPTGDVGGAVVADLARALA